MSQVIDMGNSGIQFADASPLSIDMKRYNTQFWMPSGAISYTYWGAIMTTYWDTAMTSLWDTAMSEEI